PQRFRAPGLDAVRGEPRMVESERPALAPPRAQGRDEWNEAADLRGVRADARPARTCRVPPVVDPERVQERTRAQPRGMPDDGLVYVGEPKVAGDAALDEVEVAVLRQAAVEAADRIEDLAAEEEVRGLGGSLPHLPLVVLRAVHVEQRPDGSRLGDDGADPAGGQIRVRERGQP